MTYRIDELIDIDKIKTLMESFYQAFRIPTSIIDIDGNILIGSGWQRICLDFHRKYHDSEIRCRESDKYLADHVINSKNHVLYECPHGLMDAAAPIIIDGIHMASLFTGQFLSKPLDGPVTEKFKNQAAFYGYNEKAYLEALSELPVFSGKTMEPIMKYLVNLAEVIAFLGLKVKEQKDIALSLMDSKNELSRRVDERTAELLDMNRLLNDEIEGRNKVNHELEQIVSLSEDIITVADMHGCFLKVNPAFERILGYTEKELCDKPFIEFIHPDDRTSTCDIIRNDLEKGNTVINFRNRYIAKDGGVRWLEWNSRPSGEKSYIYATARDITQRKKQEDALIKSEQILSFHISKTPLAYIRYDTELKVKDWNKSAEMIFGYSRKDVLGKRIFDLIFPSEELVSVYGMLENALNNNACGQTYLNKNITKFGDIITCEWYNTPLKDMKGRVVGLACMAKDMTERISMEQEIKKAMAELERSNQALEEFAYIASHDLREPLRKIKAFGERLEDMLKPVMDERSLDYLNRMVTASARMQRLIDDLLLYSRISTKGGEFAPINLYELAEEVIQDLEHSIEKRNATVSLSYLPEILGDPLQIKQVLQNLISNAIKFVEEGKNPQVEISGFRDDTWIHVKVKDNGIGFDPTYADKIFKPFQRLHGKNEFEGSGIGLAICDKVAKRHGGFVSAESIKGHGALFTLTLPLR